MRVAVPKEVKVHEYRVGLVPGSVRELLHTVAAPTLVLVGSQDILTPQADSEEIAEPRESFSRDHAMLHLLIFPPGRSTSTLLRITKNSVNPSPQTARGWDSRKFR